MTGSIVFRVDAARRKGLSFGHASRCLAVAEAIRDLNAQVPISFLMREDADGNAYVQEAGFPVEIMSWDCGKQAERNLIVSSGAAILIVDALDVGGYGIWAEDGGGEIVVILDDIADGRVLEAHLVANGGINATEKPYAMKGKQSKQLLGPRFAIVGKQTRQARADIGAIAKKASTCLITFGGSDPMDLTNSVVDALSGIVDGIALHVVLGPGYGPAERFRGCADLVVHRNVANLGALMGKMDMALAAGGRTAYELATLGIPAILIPSLPHEAAPIRALAAHGTAIGVDAVGPHLAGIVNKLAIDMDTRKKMRAAGRGLFDGKGATRVATEILAFCRRKNGG